MSEGQAVEDGVQEVAEALAEFVGEIRDFRQDVEDRMKKQESRMSTSIASMAVKAQRPRLAGAEPAEAPHRKAMGAYLRQGDDQGLRGLAFEGKGLTTVAAEGGYLVDPQTSETVMGVLRGAASIRAVANVVQVEATSFDVLVDRGEVGAGWGTETGAQSETDPGEFQRISIPLHALSAMPKASQRLLDDAAFDIEGWLAERIADKFMRAESQAFVDGDGVDKPLGFLRSSFEPEATWSWGNIGYVATGAPGDFASTDAADAIVDLVYALGAGYRANATFVMNSKTAGTVRKMKDADGRFLWTDSLAAGQPAQLMGYPVLICEDMPDIGPGAMAIAFGDFRAGYTIAERPDLRVLRDPFSAKPHVLFYATKRVGGRVSDYAAIKTLKFANS
jgi:HK97 family phage major capsid protein